MVIAPLASFSTAQQALDARKTEPRLTVTIGGIVTPVQGYSGQHTAGQTATGTLRLLLPRPSQVVAGAVVEVQGGHNDLVGTIFSGFVPRWEGAMTSRGDTLDVQLVGWSARLAEPFRSDVVFAGPVDAAAVFSALCQRAGVPAWIAEWALVPDGSPLMLGGNPQIDDGAVTIKANSSPLSQFQRLVEPFQYTVSDTPAGPVRFHRMLGVPGTAPALTFTEGVHLGDTRRTYDATEIVNVWDVRGATYEDAYGASVPIRSIAEPGSVTPHPEIDGGYRYRVEPNSDLVRQDLADARREVLEIQYSEADEPVRWDAVAVPGIGPGDVVTIDCDTVEANGTYWLTGIDIGSDDQSGFMATYEGRRGRGVAHPGIVDRQEISVQDTALHLGDEYEAHYAMPSPAGTEKVWNITIPADASAVNVRGIHHGTNSQVLGGTQTDLEVTKFEIWKAGVDRSNKDNRPETSGNMPVVNEDLNLRRDYTNPANWSPFAINLSRLDAGDYVLRLIAGVKGGVDDFEVDNVIVEYFGLVSAAGAS